MSGSIPWPFAKRIGGLVAGDHPLAASYHLEHLELTLPDLVSMANRLVAEETGLPLPGRAETLVISRRQWVDRNVSVFSEMLRPAEAKIAARLDQAGEDGPALARRMVAAQTGALLGFLARRVLGQYELVVPGGDDGDVIAFVGANLLQMERAHQLNPREFRIWVALHETTHRAQFVGVPWMRDYFRSLVTEMVEASTADEAKLSRLVERLVESRRNQTKLLDQGGVLTMLAGPEQRQALERIQALMSLLEGHGHVVMDRLGDRLLVSRPRMSALLKARRQDPKTAAFLRITGLEMKMRQYQDGERFVVAVERRVGWERLSRAWGQPETLPTLAEIREPERWIDRVV